MDSRLSIILIIICLLITSSNLVSGKSCDDVCKEFGYNGSCMLKSECVSTQHYCGLNSNICYYNLRNSEEFPGFPGLEVLGCPSGSVCCCFKTTPCDISYEKCSEKCRAWGCFVVKKPVKCICTGVCHGREITEEAVKYHGYFGGEDMEIECCRTCKEIWGQACGGYANCVRDEKGCESCCTKWCSDIDDEDAKKQCEITCAANCRNYRKIIEILNLISLVAVIIAAVLFAIHGLALITSFGPYERSEAKQSIKYVIIALVLLAISINFINILFYTFRSPGGGTKTPVCNRVITNEICDDNIDNDLDGCIDEVDSDCGGKEVECSDNIDNDCDSLIDCDDADCSDDPSCKGEVECIFNAEDIYSP